jgi:hypothetical protein
MAADWPRVLCSSQGVTRRVTAREASAPLSVRRWPARLPAQVRHRHRHRQPPGRLVQVRLGWERPVIV